MDEEKDEYSKTKFRELCVSVSFLDCILSLSVIPKLALEWIEKQEHDPNGFVKKKLMNMQSEAEALQKYIYGALEAEGGCKVDDAERRHKVAWRMAKRLLKHMHLFRRT